MSKAKIKFTYQDYKNLPESETKRYELLEGGRERTYKCTLDARHGVQEYWLVDSREQTVEVLTLSEAQFKPARIYGKAGILKSTVLSNLEINLCEIF